MAQQSQPVPFNALKPATWGSLRLLPQALRSKLVGTKTNENGGFGKENISNQYAVPQAPPKIGDLSHLQAIGPRRNVNQRYVLQPNLNVRPAAHAPGLSGLLLPGMAPGLPQHQQPQRQPLQQQQSTQVLQPQHLQQQTTGRQSRSSTPSSPSARGRQPAHNPNFVSSNITTRLPTPVRINASPGPSPSPGNNVALTLPKPPSPSRSLSQGGAGPANPFAYGSVCSSPAASTPTSSTFALPMPPSIFSGAPGSRPSQTRNPQAMPWASASAGGAPQGKGYTTPSSVRPSPPVPERSILASVQLPTQHPQQQRTPGQAATVTGVASGATNLSAAFNGVHKHQQHQNQQVAAAAAAPEDAQVVPGISVSPVITAAPAIQAALQQALQAAMERKPEAFRVDNFEAIFDSMMHPGTATKLDGPLGHELPDDVRYSDNWYKHCRDWNKNNKPCAPYVPPAGSAAATAAAPQQQQQQGAVAAAAPGDVGQGHEQRQDQGSRPTSSPSWLASELEEKPLSEACCKALDIAHHGLRKVLTPTARSRSVSAMGSAAASAPQSLLQQFEKQHQHQHQQQDLEDTASSRPAAAAATTAGDSRAVSTEVVTTAAALTTALEALALAQDHVVDTAATAAVSGGQGKAAAEATAAPQPDGISSQAAVEAAAPTGEVRTPRQAVTGAAVGIRKAPQLAVVVDGHETPVVPTAAGASLAEFQSPAPGSTRPPGSTATTPGPKTPGGDDGGGGGGGAESVATTAATTPAGRTHTAANTPTTATATAAANGRTRVGSLQLAGVESALGLESARSEAGASPLQRRLSTERSASLPAVEHTPAAAAAAAAIMEPSPPPSVPAASPTASDTGCLDSAGLWSPAFPPVAHAASMVRGAVAAAGAVPHRPPSPVTLLQSPPREMPTPNPAFLSAVVGGAQAAGPSGLAAAVAAVAAPRGAIGGVFRDPAGPSTSSAPPPVDPLKEIVVGIEKLSTLKHSILAEDKEVDVASITQMIQLKLAVEQLLAKTSTAAQSVAAPTAVEPAVPAATAAAAAPHGVAEASAAAAAAGSDASAGQQVAGTPQKNVRSGGFGAFLKSVFSPRAGSASKVQQQQQLVAPSSVQRTFGANITAAAVNGAAVAPLAVAPVSPAAAAVGIMPARPASAAAAPRHVASPSIADRSRYAALHQKAAARLAEAAAEPSGVRQAAAPAQTAASAAAAPAPAPAGQVARADLWRRYEEKIAVHRHQLDTTKSQLDEAVRKLNDMQTEFDELLLCLGMESAKNKALCDAMRAAGLDPEPILAAIEEQWMSGGFPE